MSARSGRNIISLSLLILAVVSAAAVNGCTFIGFTAGTLIDNESIHSVAISQADSLKPGVWLEITLDDSTEVAGHFAGTDGMYRSQYRASYAEVRKKLSRVVELPALGSAVRCTDTTGDSLEGNFFGFDLDRMMESLVLIRERNEVNFRAVGLSSLRSLQDSVGTPFKLASIDKSIQNNEIPVASKGILIENRTSLSRVAISEVAKMKIDNDPKAERIAWLPGLVLGLAMDAACYNYIVPLLVKSEAGY